MPKLSYIPINKLKIHERVNLSREKEIRNDIKDKRVLRNPLIVDLNTMIILDGHHRFLALKKLRAKRIPVYLVDYRDSSIKVSSRRKNYKLSKLEIVFRGLNNNPLPYRTSKHLIPNRPMNINIPLKKII